MNIAFNNKVYTVNPNNFEKIDYFDIKTHKIRVGDTVVFWCPLHWAWIDFNEKSKLEVKYKDKLKVIYYKETIFLVKKAHMRKRIVDGEVCDVAPLPVGVVFWNGDEWNLML